MGEISKYIKSIGWVATIVPWHESDATLYQNIFTGEIDSFEIGFYTKDPFIFIAQKELTEDEEKKKYNEHKATIISVNNDDEDNSGKSSFTDAHLLKYDKSTNLCAYEGHVDKTLGLDLLEIDENQKPEVLIPYYEEDYATINENYRPKIIEGKIEESDSFITISCKAKNESIGGPVLLKEDPTKCIGIIKSIKEVNETEYKVKAISASEIKEFIKGL